MNALYCPGCDRKIKFAAGVGVYRIPPDYQHVVPYVICAACAANPTRWKRLVADDVIDKRLLSDTKRYCPLPDFIPVRN